MCPTDMHYQEKQALSQMVASHYWIMSSLFYLLNYIRLSVNLIKGLLAPVTGAEDLKIVSDVTNSKGSSAVLFHSFPCDLFLLFKLAWYRYSWFPLEIESAIKGKGHYEVINNPLKIIPLKLSLIKISQLSVCITNRFFASLRSC